MKHIFRSPPLTSAGKLLLAGHILILAALCDFAARLASGSVEHLLYLESFIGSVSSSVVLLWGIALGWEWLDRSRYPTKP